MDVYIGLFISAFLSATLLPGSSEILIVALRAEGYDILPLWLWATAGNTLGSAVNWMLGYYLLHFQHRKWFPFKADGLLKAQQWFNRYGIWSLLFAWAPLVGDALTFIAGVMKVPFFLFLVLVLVGKAIRYALILGIVDWLF